MTLSAFAPHPAARTCAWWALALAVSTPALAQGAAAATPGASAPDAAWRSCAAMTADSNARLACFDGWAQQQSLGTPVAAGGAPSPGIGQTAAAPKAQVDTTLPATRVIEVARTEGCRDPQYSETFALLGTGIGHRLRQLQFPRLPAHQRLAVAASNVNRYPGAAGVPSTDPTPYRRTEARLQLSVRTKVAQNLLTQGDPTRRDSLWFGYTQQSYWQVFSGDISRPFRATDHEPEMMYVYPTDAKLPFGWRWRYSGVGRRTSPLTARANRCRAAGTAPT